MARQVCGVGFDLCGAMWFKFCVSSARYLSFGGSVPVDTLLDLVANS